MSATKQRKDRERAQREDLMVEQASRLLARDGFQDLNLDELAGQIEYSKGTIYLHFETKEDLVLAVATRALRERADLFEKASTFTGRTRERMRAIGFACCQFAVAHRDFFHVELMLRSNSFWGRASEGRKRLHAVQAGRLFQIVSSIVNEAVRLEDLPPRASPQEVTFSLISVTMGSHIAAMEPDIQMICSIKDPIAAVRRNQDLVCDGWGWKPLLKDWDYASTDRRIKAQVFPEASWFRA
ncbi:MAG: TetR/AcrR family transcriptional regulator [Verrucomicrobia bacterium]|nr:TetR/AcrR family transcriptional regulator [Verrucomicrobiota bacterium]